MSSQITKTVVPWFNPEQFRKVYKHLFSKNISDKRWATDQIAVWETRCCPALPVSIEASAVIVRAMIQDLLYQAGKTFCQEQDIKSLYALALVRFINLILENDKEAGEYKDIAIKYNLPPWIVDIRHDATHSHCPPLPVLRIGAERALQYLEENFWKEAASQTRSVKYPLNQNRDMIVNLISSFRANQFCSLKNNDGDISQIHQSSKNIVKKIKYFVQHYCDTFMETFVEPGIFIVPNDLVQLLCNKGCFFLESEDVIALPDVVEQFWRPIITLLHQHNLIPRFLESLLLSQQKCHVPICQKVAIAWVLEMLMAMNADSSSYLARLFSDRALKINYHRLLYACMKSATKYSLHLLNIITDRLGDKEQYNELFCLLALHQGVFVDKEAVKQSRKLRKRSVDKADLVFSLEDLETDILEIKAKKSKTTGKNVWSMAEGSIKFEELPLGTIINPMVTESSDTSVQKPTGVESSFIPCNITDNEGASEETLTPDDNMIGIGKVKMLYKKRA